MDPSTQEQLYLIDPNPEAFVDFNLLWSLSFGYSFNYSNPGTYGPSAIGPNVRTTQALDVNGDFSLTPKWKIGFQTSYDFERAEVGSTSLSIFRDLHCWALRSEEHTSELQSLMRISYAVFCLKKKNKT